MPKCRRMTIEVELDGTLADGLQRYAELQSAEFGTEVTPEQCAHQWLLQSAQSRGLAPFGPALIGKR
jgi:hypothetical protein